MLREQLCQVLERLHCSYSDLASTAIDSTIQTAASNAARSVALTIERVRNPQERYQQRHPSEYALKRLVDIQIRFIEKMPVNSDELRRARQIEAMRNVTIDLRSLIESERSA